jgi:hypothetical protein
MRTTIRLDNELLARLKTQARRENVSLTGLVNRTLRAGMQAARGQQARRPKFREQAVSMGVPRVALDKALSLAASLEDEEISRELALRK